MLIAELAAAAVILAVIKFGSRVPAVKAAFASYTGF